MPIKKEITITVKPGEDYFADVERRLEAYGILKREVAESMGTTESQFSRWFRVDDDTGKRIQPRIDTVVKVEQAILELRRKHREPRPRPQNDD